jgi:hypothetical protein
MKLRQVAVVLTLCTFTLGWPHHKGVSKSHHNEFEILEIPIHTTALMDREAWSLTERAKSASATRYPPSIPTKFIKPSELYEL